MDTYNPLKDLFGRSQSVENERSAGPSDKQRMLNDPDESCMEAASSCFSTTVPDEEDATELHAKASLCTTQVEDLKAANESLRGQLEKAHFFLVPFAQASSAASLAVVEDLRMENHHLLETVKASREESAQKQGTMERAIEDNVDLRRKHEEMSGRMMLLNDDIDFLKKKMYAERQRRVDAEEQRCAQKELFHSMFMKMKHVMDQRNSEHASSAMKDRGAPLGEHVRSAAEKHAFPFNKRNASASELLARDKFNDDMAPSHGMKTSSHFLLAEGSVPTAPPSLNLHYLDVWP